MRRSILAVAAVAAASLSLGACGTGDAGESSGGESAAKGSLKTGPGVDAATKTIRVGELSALSGPAAALGKPVVAGHQAFFEALNARGGIDGWKIDLTVKDTGYQPQQHVQAFNQLKGDIAILNSFGSPTTKAIQPQFQGEKLVTVPASFDSIWGTDPTVAPVGTPYSIDVANALDYVTDGGAKKPKVGIIYQNDEYGADGLRGFDAAQGRARVHGRRPPVLQARRHRLHRPGAEAEGRRRRRRRPDRAAERDRPDRRHRRHARVHAAVDPPGPVLHRAADHRGRHRRAPSRRRSRRP